MESNPLARLLDSVAVQDEHSHVDPQTRAQIRALVLERNEDEALAVTAERIGSQLSAAGLAQVVADWLDAQAAI